MSGQIQVGNREQILSATVGTIYQSSVSPEIFRSRWHYQSRLYSSSINRFCFYYAADSVIQLQRFYLVSENPFFFSFFFFCFFISEQKLKLFGSQSTQSWSGNTLGFVALVSIHDLWNKLTECIFTTTFINVFDNLSWLKLPLAFLYWEVWFGNFSPPCPHSLILSPKKLHYET